MKNISSRMAFISILIFIGIVLRFVVGSMGFTYDLQSYEIVAKIVTAGGNVYKETTRYNYGPVWFSILGLFYTSSKLFSDSFLVFRFLIIGFLTVVDLGIWYVLYKRYNLLVSLLFFLNPLSIILTGYYSQFDNFAVLFGFLAMDQLEKSSPDKVDVRFFRGILLLGLSLITKHIFFALPLWLFFSQKKLNKKIIILIIPVIIFFLSFLPFIRNGFDGIKHNVFLYSSFNNAPLWQSLVPDYLKRYLRKQLLFFGMLIVGAIVFKRKKPFEQLLFYSMTLVTFSYAIADQYFAIVIPFISIFFNIFFGGFVIVQLLFFIMIMKGGEVLWFNMYWDRSTFGFTIQLFLLFFGFIFVLYRIYFPKFSIRHLIALFIILNTVYYGGIVYPSWKEDQQIKPIVMMIKKGDYESANTLYHKKIEGNPPFAGSRYYEKLRFVRENIEYYRTYRYALDGYNDHTKQRDWKKIKKELQHIPYDFPEKQTVYKIIDYAEIHI